MGEREEARTESGSDSGTRRRRLLPPVVEVACCAKTATEIDINVSGCVAKAVRGAVAHFAIPYTVAGYIRQWVCDMNC